MDKKAKEGIPCTYCGEDALPDTCPPVCEGHKKNLAKQAAAAEPATLKELSQKESD